VEEALERLASEGERLGVRVAAQAAFNLLGGVDVLVPEVEVVGIVLLLYHASVVGRWQYPMKQSAGDLGAGVGQLRARFGR